MKEDFIYVQGIVVKDLPGRWYLVELDRTHRHIRCYLSGHMLRHKISCLPGDRVDVAIGTYDLDAGRITYRYKT